VRNYSIIRMLSIFASAITLLTFVSLPSTAENRLTPIDVGPDKGVLIKQIDAVNQFGNTMNIEQLMRKQGLLLILFRSADWCPYCKRHLLELNEFAEKFNKLGYGVAAISYDAPAILRNFSQKHRLTYELLSDRDQQTFKLFNVLNKDYKPGDKHYGIPYPGVLVIGADKKLRDKYFYQGYKTRVRFAMLLNYLKKP